MVVLKTLILQKYKCKNSHIWELLPNFATLNKSIHQMKVNFKDEALLELYEYGKTKDKKYKKVCKVKKLVEGYQRAVSLMLDVETTEELSNFSFLHYEKLKHISRSSVRLANGMIERLIFTESDGGIEVELIEIDSTHYGNKK